LQNLFKDLESLLQQDQAFISDGAILKNAVTEAALNMDAGLLALLMQSPTIKAHFFTEVAGALVFDKVKFQDFVSNKAFLPDSYTAFKNRIGLTNGRGDYLSQSRDVVLAWPYKDCVLEGGMTKEDRGRNEVFWNTTLAPDDISRLFEPKVLTDWERWDAEAVAAGKPKPVGDVSKVDNLLIKGNNLLALHSLKARYAGKVKLIYIDPPYNTESDSFKYNDRFSRASWLTFMKGRLEVAKSLMTRDGVIAVQISDKEQAYLKVLLDEIFEENYRATLAVKMSHLSGVKMAHKDKKIIKTIEYIHIYSKSDAPLKLNPQYTSTTWEDAFDRHTSFLVKGSSDLDDMQQWKSIPLRRAISEAGVNREDREELLDFLVANAHLIFQTAANKSANYSKEPRGVFQKVDGTLILNGREVDFASNKMREINGKPSPVSIVGDIWTDIGINNVFQEGGEDIDLPFGKKPEMLLDRLIRTFTEETDVVMDFFAGTGTTACVAHKLSRQWLAVEQLDYISTLTLPRLKSVLGGDQTGVSKGAGWQGGGSFVYAELAASNSAFAGRIETATDMAILQTIQADIQATGYLRYNVDLSAFDTHDFAALPLDDAKRVLLDCLDTNHLYINLHSLGDAAFDISDEDAAATRSFYGITE
jgi:adenine-specific DNA-methyltransferase